MPHLAIFLVVVIATILKADAAVEVACNVLCESRTIANPFIPKVSLRHVNITHVFIVFIGESDSNIGTLSNFVEAAYRTINSDSCKMLALLIDTRVDLAIVSWLLEQKTITVDGEERPILEQVAMLDTATAQRHSAAAAMLRMVHHRYKSYRRETTSNKATRRTVYSSPSLLNLVLTDVIGGACGGQSNLFSVFDKAKFVGETVNATRSFEVANLWAGCSEYSTKTLHCPIASQPSELGPLEALQQYVASLANDLLVDSQHASPENLCYFLTHSDTVSVFSVQIDREHTTGLWDSWSANFDAMFSVFSVCMITVLFAVILCMLCCRANDMPTREEENDIRLAADSGTIATIQDLGTEAAIFSQAHWPLRRVIK